MENQKGLVQIPLLVLIIISLVVGTGVVLYRQGTQRRIAELEGKTQELEGRLEEKLQEEQKIEETKGEDLTQQKNKEEIISKFSASVVENLNQPELETEDSEEELEVAELKSEPVPEPEIEGCIDSSALNYNPEATKDNYSCEYEVKGCTDLGALNYDAGANTDDGSCEYKKTEVGGIILKDTTWTKENSPYVITSTVQIPSGVTLTIKPGVTVTKPTSGDMFLVNGTIYTRGIKEDKIIFDGGDNSDFFHITGSESAFLDLEYCIVKNGFMFWPGGNHNGHFHLQHSELINLAEQSTMWFPSGNIVINYNRFVNTYGFRIYTDNDVKVYIKNNLFYKGHSLNDTGNLNFYILVGSQDSSEVTIKYNSFIDMSNIVLKLSDISINTFSASENYWGTQDKNAIESMIYDRNDDIRCVGYVNYLPILKESHSNTPEL